MSDENADTVQTEEVEQILEDNASEPASTAAGQEFPAADLENLTPGQSSEQPRPAADMNLDVILDVPVTISVEIGRTQIPIRQLLQYHQGSVIELDRRIGEPLDVLVNGTLIAHGEVVMVDEQFGIRLTDVVSPSERVKKLK